MAAGNGLPTVARPADTNSASKRQAVMLSIKARALSQTIMDGATNAGGNEMHVAAILKVKGRNVVTTRVGKSLLDVAKLLEQYHIGCIVIEGDEGQVAGIVSERDVVRAIGKSGAKVLKEPVSGYMTKTVVAAREADTIDRLMSEMTTHRFRHMPVVERGRLIGLVSIGDVVKMHIAEADMEAVATRAYAA
jgi:CBS domain-containing protein